MKTYHYCVIYESDRQTHWKHGLFTCSEVTSSNYLEVVDKIAEGMSPPRRGDQVVVSSLTLIADDSR